MRIHKTNHLGCNKPNHNECQPPHHDQCHKPQECPCDRFSEFRPLTPKDGELFYIALKDFCGSEFIPFIVSTQVCDGYNFIFLAEKIIPGSCTTPTLAYVKICMMHCGKIRLISIKDAHIYPETDNDCLHIPCDKQHCKNKHSSSCFPPCI